eukprot:NODE_526_length_6458_cov_1.113854.p3 type:complete len:263 gc:universal NODE_526_length_6458_cov_1.113854:4510-3722(-)
MVSQPYVINLNENCPKISPECTFQYSVEIQGSLEQIENQCSDKCKEELKTTLPCQNKEIAQLLIRMYNAKCSEVDGEVCWVSYLEYIKPTYYYTNQTLAPLKLPCTDCMKSLMHYEDSLARYLENQFAISQRQFYFMRFHRHYLEDSCGLYFGEFGSDINQVTLAGDSAPVHLSDFPIYAYFVIVFGALGLVFLIGVMWRRYKQNKKTTVDSPVAPTDTISSWNEIRCAPDLRRLSTTSDLKTLQRQSMQSLNSLSRNSFIE